MKIETRETDHHLECFRIINNIAFGGLKSARKLISEQTNYYSSNDVFPRNDVFGIKITPFMLDTNSAKERHFRSSLYNHANALFPVLLERPGEIRTNSDSMKLVSDNEIKQECERRAAASFIIALDYDKLNNAFDTSHIPSSYFDYAVFPEHVFNNYTQQESRIHFPTHVKIIKVEHKITRYIKDGIDMELDIPDYEGALKNILDCGINNLFVHGVRLPLVKEKKLFTTRHPY